MNDRPWLAHYDKGVPQTIEYPKAPLFHFLEEAAQKYPDRACTIFKGAVISYREMNALTDHMAAALVELGVKKGDRVGIFMPNTPQFVMAFFGILKAGGVVVATNPLYTPPEIEHVPRNPQIGAEGGVSQAEEQGDDPQDQPCDRHPPAGAAHRQGAKNDGYSGEGNAADRKKP